MVIHGYTWSCMVMYGNVWPCEVMFGNMWSWSCVFMYDLWLSMIMYGCKGLARSCTVQPPNCLLQVPVVHTFGNMGCYDDNIISRGGTRKYFSFLSSSDTLILILLRILSPLMMVASPINSTITSNSWY